MKITTAVFLSLVVAMALNGCGSGANSSTINGNWTAALTTSATGSPNFAFTVALAENGDGTLNITNLTFTTASPCFGSNTTATGGFTLSGNFNGVNSGGFQMTIQSGAAGSSNNNNNVLTLQGTLTNNSISGNWTLTGVATGCTGSGTFTMSRM